MEVELYSVRHKGSKCSTDWSTSTESAARGFPNCLDDAGFDIDAVSRVLCALTLLPSLLRVCLYCVGMGGRSLIYVEF